jgi:NAD(P)-dependent dehydrogenase (short-subunit alcohol dehydrogenase family)
MISLDLSGRTAVVAGGTGGIGQAITRNLLDAGAKIAIWDLRASALTSPDLISLRADLTDEASVSAAMSDTLKRFDSVEILVNCAGLVGTEVLMENYTLSDWRKIMDVNLTSTFLCSRAVIPTMRSGGYGRIISLASNAGKDCNPYQSAYCAAKAGVIALMKALGRELAQTGILVHSVTPALIETEMAQAIPEANRKILLDKIPMKRMGQPQEVADLVTWLASARCSFTTGATHDLSGGRGSY